MRVGDPYTGDRVLEEESWWNKYGPLVIVVAVVVPSAAVLIYAKISESSGNLEKCTKDCGYFGEAAIQLCVEEDWSLEYRKVTCLMPAARDRLEKVSDNASRASKTGSD
jgi:hypothetical protein